MPDGTALRLNVAAALKEIGASGTRLSFRETGTGTTRAISIDMPKLISTVGDIILSRKDFPGSYHLSVVLDDAAQNVTHVIRGTDLFDATQIHVVLQKLLGLATPTYHHHRLIRDAAGKRLAKRDDARAIAKYRADGATPQDIREKVGL
jgi:glutamyl-Q tRNA(Asp) synthetase